MSFTVIIPARLASTRLPGKMLLDIAGKPMLQHVFEKACLSKAQRVLIATDHPDIQAVATAFGAEVCMTDIFHRSGSERINEVVRTLAMAEAEVVVNVQGDEPMLPPENINQVAELLLCKPEREMATLCSPIQHTEDVFDPNVVKLVKDVLGKAIYFSRAPIPWDRQHFRCDDNGGFRVDGELPQLCSTYWKHIGIYAYRAGFLQTYVQWPWSALEQSESLEQLRVLEQGRSIWVAPAVSDPGIGVDTHADLDRVRRIFESGPT